MHLARSPLPLSLVVALTAIALASSAQGKASSVRLEDLVAYADLIVVAKVTEVHVADSKRFATVVVKETIKGNASSPIVVFAASTWSCDVTGDIEPGSDGLFLLRAVQDPLDPASGVVFRVLHSGRGFMPRVQRHGREAFGIFAGGSEPGSEVVVPKEWVLLDEDRDPLVYVPADVLKAAIRQFEGK